MSINLANKFFCLLVCIPFFSVFWPMGMFQESDIAFFGLWFVAGIGVFLFINNFNTLKLPVVSYFFLVMALLSVLGAFQNDLVALGGINEIREGAATFLACSIIIVIGNHLNLQYLPLWLAPIAYGLLTIIGHYDWIHYGWMTYVFLDIAAFPLLASLPMYVIFRSSLKTSQHLWDAAYLAAFSFLFFYCDNKAAIIALLCALIFVYVLPLAKKFLSFLPRKDGGYIVFGLGFIAVMILISWTFFSQIPPQLQSRTLLGIVTVFHYFDNFTFSKLFHVLFGYGWGSYQEFPVLNLFRLENFTIYSSGSFNPNWEFLQRNLLHSHNLVLETLVSMGVVGVGVLLVFIYKWIESIDKKDWAGRVFIVSYLILLSAWFQTPPVLIFLLIAIALVKESTTSSITIPRFIWMGIGAFLIAFSCVELWSSVSLNKYQFKSIQSFEHDISKFINHPAHSYDKRSTYKASNMIIGGFSHGLSGLTKADVKYLPDVERSIVLVLQDYLNSPQQRNVVSSVHVINLCNTYASLQKVNILSKSDFFKLFKTIVLKHIAKFPERADMSIGFFNLCFDKLDNIKEVNEMADAVLSVMPNHPVGLWFKGLSGLSSSGVEKMQSLEKMRLAVKLGLCRFMPVPKELLANLGIQQ